MSATIRRAARDIGKREPHWPASLAVIGAIGLYMTLPDQLIAVSRYVLPALEACLLVPLTFGVRTRHETERRIIRVASLVLIGLVNLANVISLVLLTHDLVGGGQVSGHVLILAAIQIWLTNVLIFGLWYWELDRGGPGNRVGNRPSPPDFLFPQMTNPEACEVRDWRPSFLDYLFVSFTNATAFSPTDTMPLSEGAKLLMAVQSLASLITVALVAARAVNILT